MQNHVSFKYAIRWRKWLCVMADLVLYTLCRVPSSGNTHYIKESIRNIRANRRKTGCTQCGEGEELKDVLFLFKAYALRFPSSTHIIHVCLQMGKRRNTNTNTYDIIFVVFCSNYNETSKFHVIEYVLLI